MSKADACVGAVLAACVILLVAPLRSSAQVNPAARTKWEYEIVKDDGVDLPNRAKANTLGSEGWELVHIEGQYPSSSEAGVTSYSTRILYFKRPKQ